MSDFTFKAEDLVFDSIEDAKKTYFKNMCMAMQSKDPKKSRYWFKQYQNIKGM